MNKPIRSSFGLLTLATFTMVLLTGCFKSKQTFDCISGTCIQTEDGVYVSKSACENNCGSGPTTGTVTFWVRQDYGCGYFTVVINSQIGTIDGFYSSGISDCNRSGCANFTLPPGTYTYNVACSSYNNSNTVTITSGGCVRREIIP
jgi:hypothetical protein